MPLHAHDHPGEMSRVQINATHHQAHVRVMARSHAFNDIIELDADHNHIVTVDELHPHHDALGTHVTSHLELRVEDQTQCTGHFKELTYNARSQIIDAQFMYRCPESWSTLTVTQTLFSEHDATHRVLVTIREGDQDLNTLLTTQQPSLTYRSVLRSSTTATTSPAPPRNAPSTTPEQPSPPETPQTPWIIAIVLGVLLTLALGLAAYRARTD